MLCYLNNVAYNSANANVSCNYNDIMNDFFSLVGSVASLVSIPLAIYLYLKSKEAKFDRLKKDIVKVLSYQIGDERQLSTFEIKTVISSKLRENRIKIDSVSVTEVIEDLVSETISSPLIGKDRKTKILDNLKKIYLKGGLFEEIEAITESDEDSAEAIEPKVKTMIQHRIRLKRDSEHLDEFRKRYRQSISTMFLLISFIITTITVIVAIVGNDTFEEWNKKLEDPFKGNEFVVTITMGAIASILAGAATYLFRKKRK